MNAPEPADRQETETLLRACVLFKFSGAEDADPFVGSPVYARALRKLLEAAVRVAVEAGDPRRAEGWRTTYRLSGHRERWDLVVTYAARHPEWTALGSEERREWIDVIASPYWLEEKEYHMLVEAVDRRSAV